MAGKMPLVEALSQYIVQDVVPFHMPGHKMGRGFSPEFARNIIKMDVTEIPGMDNLHEASGVIDEAQKLAAKAFGADRTFFLVNGSTCGIHAMIMAACKPGDKLLVPRNCHRSVWEAMVLADVWPVYIQPEYDEYHLWVTQLLPERVEEALNENPDVTGMVLVHPNYYGMCSRIEEIEQLVHGRGKILLVDEAHGAHFIFHPSLPPSAGEVGADVWVQSAHKTLPAFTQAAYMHIRGKRVNKGEIRDMLGISQTTSPSYMIMASLDWARNYMVEYGEKKLEVLLDRISETTSKLRKNSTVSIIEEYRRNEVGYIDPTRLVIDVRNLGISGYKAEKILREKGIQVEMSDFYHIVLICSVADDKEMLDRLVKCWGFLEDERASGKIHSLPLAFYSTIPKQVLSPREAFFSEKENVPLEDSVGRICAGIVGTYPPGIPRFCPGELIDSEGIEELCIIREYGGMLFGMTERELMPVVKN